MKKHLFCFLLLLLFTSFPIHAEEAEMRGVWVSSVYNLDYPSRPGLSEAQLKKEADQIIQTASDWGMNTIFLQVRPSADALYRSEIIPWSQYLSGEQGQAADNSFDPLAYFTQKCHSRNIKLHAWLNPYRITRKAAASREEAFSQLCEGHPALTMSDLIVFHSDGCLYFDPGRPEVRDFLLSVIDEILENYPVDGIHFDDYFYPGTEFDDAKTRAELSSEFQSADDFRRNAVNLLIREVHQLVAEKMPKREFGVSPAGIWATDMHKPEGAATVGSQSYFDHYADSRKWVREGYVDYIVPQIYWEIGAEAGDFSILSDWWSDVVSDTDTDLYIGIAAYKTVQAENGSVWYGSEEILRQLALIRQNEQIGGAVFFRYGSIKSSELSSALPQFYRDMKPLPAKNRPTDIRFSEKEYSIAVKSGEGFPISCEAPRGSRVTAHYGSKFVRMKSDFNGHYSGRMTAATPYHSEAYTSPLVLCAEKFGMLFVELSPNTISSVKTDQDSGIDSVTVIERDTEKQLLFQAQSPFAAKLSKSGDVLTLELDPCSKADPFSDSVFQEVEVFHIENTVLYRMVLSEEEKDCRIQLYWEPDRIRILLKKMPPADPAVPR